MTTAESTSPPSLLDPEEIAVHLRALASIVEVKLLDKYWTAEAVKPSAGRRDLSPVVDRMAELIEELKSLAPQVAETASRHRDVLQPRFERAVNTRRRARELFPENVRGDVAASAAAVADSVVSMADGEVAHLRGELSRLQADQRSDGDLTAEFDGTLDAFGYHIEVHVEVDLTTVGGILAGLLALL